VDEPLCLLGYGIYQGLIPIPQEVYCYTGYKIEIRSSFRIIDHTSFSALYHQRKPGIG
jgi:hypothetical protein